jgi:hypothetical protein
MIDIEESKSIVRKNDRIFKKAMKQIKSNNEELKRLF